MITVKEEFLTEEKTERAIELGGDAVIRMWLALKSYAARKLTNGFIPDEAIDKLKGAPKSPRKALTALIDCGLLQPDGTRGAGLVDKAPHGYELHDYLDHANSAEDEERRREKERERKAFGRAIKRLADEVGESFEATRARFSDDATSAQVHAFRVGLSADKSVASPRTVRGQNLDSPSDVQGGSPQDVPRARDRASQPSPAQPSQSSGKQAAEDQPAPPDQPNEQQRQLKIPCPADLALTTEQRGTLEIGGIQAHAFAPLTLRFVAKARADLDDTRSLVAWRKALAAAVAGDWNNPRTRPTDPAKTPPGARSGRAGDLLAGQLERVAQLEAEERAAAEGGSS